jgi:hypothetical protein
MLLLGSNELLVRYLGMYLFLWIPACGYYSWKARKSFPPQESTGIRPCVPLGMAAALVPVPAAVRVPRQRQ